MLKIKNLFLKKGNFTLNNISINISKNEYFILLGKTGSGKTLLLESIAGFHNIKGKIFCENRDITKDPPEKRNFGFVYQDFALFPNMTVEKNIRFSEKFKGKNNKLFQDLINFLGIEKLLKRKTHHLSGGEKQRTALARAIYSRPKLLLLDEPLSAIDPTFRNEIMKNLKESISRYNLTIIHVTHNFREASYLGDKIGIMINGEILQTGKTKDVLESPSSIEVAKFLGFKNLFDVKFLNFHNSHQYFSIDPNNIKISNKKENFNYCLNGVIEEIMDIADHYKIFVNVRKNIFFIKLPTKKFKYLTLQKKQKVYICFNKKDIIFI